MTNAADIAVIIAISSITLLLIIAVFGLLLMHPKKVVVRPRKASLPPLHGGYRPRQGGGDLQVNRNPPKAPTGSGAGSPARESPAGFLPGETSYDRNERWARESAPNIM